MKENNLYRTLFFVFIILLTGFSSYSKTITSKSQGGLWNEITTWEGGVVPTQTDDVIINSIVTTGNVNYSTRTL